jgi:hypothetical protein
LTIEQVQKVRESVPLGLKESAFYMGTREMIHLFDSLVTVDQESPYEPFTTKVYQTQGEGVIVSLPFTVGAEGEVVYASILDCSDIASLDLAIYNSDFEEVTISDQQKYQNIINQQSLPQG